MRLKLTGALVLKEAVVSCPGGHGTFVHHSRAAGGLQRNSSIVADSLLVRQLVVIDSQGMVRARLGAHLPDAVIDGRRLRGGGDMAGVLLYDDTGRERAGYVTFSPSRLGALPLVPPD